MNRKLLEARVSRLERLILKNEFLGYDKLSAKEEKDFVLKLYSKYPSMRTVFGGYNAKKLPDEIFKIELSPTDDTEYDGIRFEISTDGDRKEVFVKAFDGDNEVLGTLRRLDIDKDVNKIAAFIMQTLQNNRVSNEGRLHKKCEGVPLTLFECESIQQDIADQLDDLPKCKVKVIDDNAEYGYIKIEIGDPKLVTSYSINADSVKSFTVSNNDKKVGTEKTIDDAIDLLCEDFMDKYINGKFK